MKFNEEMLSASYGSSPDGFIPAMAIVNFLENKNRILIIGDFTKRDYTVLSALGKEVHVIDIVHIEGIKKFYLQSITQKTSFEAKYFDGVVLAEVVEHLFEDYVALNEIYRILKDDGVLVITVPYFSNVQDNPEYHVRIHSGKTIRRLLQHSGFAIETHFYRGLVSRIPQKNLFTKYLLFGFRKVLIKLCAQRGEQLFRRWCYQAEYFLGTKSLLLPIQRQCTSFGGIMKVVKGQSVDFMKIQIKEFSSSDSAATEKSPGA